MATGGGSAIGRPLGSGSAEHDRRFAEHFVATLEFNGLANDDCVIVFGAKGSGKTALMRALQEFYADRFATVHGVRLDDLKFGPLFAQLKKLDSASNHGVVSIARSMWRNVIAIYALEAILATNLLDQKKRTQTKKYLQSGGYLGTGATQKLSSHLERVWKLIDRWSRDTESQGEHTLDAFTPKQHAIITAFPSDNQLSSLLVDSMKIVKSANTPILLCIDGLDSIIEHSIESRNIIFAGLIDAAYKCVSDPLLSGWLNLKILLPKELAHGARRHLRDLDKAEQFIRNIHWGKADLAEFLRRRLDDHVKIKGRPFEEVWKEYFPEKVRNESHGFEEETFHYILRHTFYRPRQVLFHIQGLLDKWDASSLSGRFRVDPSFIPKAIAEGNISLTEYIVNELELDFPNLDQFLRSFRGVSCVQPWSEVRSRMERFLGLSGAELEQGFTDLYNYGLVGIRQHLSPDEPAMSSRRIARYQFGFMTPRVRANVDWQLANDSEIALAPMVKDFCGCKASISGVVVPIVGGRI